METGSPGCTRCPWVLARELWFLFGTSGNCSLGNGRAQGWGPLFPACCSSPSPLGRYLGDGRFHLESIMIANPGIPAYRYGQPQAAAPVPTSGEHPSSPSTLLVHPPPWAWAGTDGQGAMGRVKRVGEEVQRGDEHQPFTPAEYKHFDKYL